MKTLTKQDVGVWVTCKEGLPADWDYKQLRYSEDHYPIDNDLFEVKNNALCKISGIGRLEFKEIEWLKPVKGVYVLTENELEEFVEKFKIWKIVNEDGLNFREERIHSEKELLNQFLESIKSKS